WRQAAQDQQQELVKRGHWRAKVSGEEAYDPRTARADLTFPVEAAPRLEVAFAGAAVAEPALLGEVRQLLRDGGAGADAVAEASERIEDAFRRQGHREVRVTPREDVREGGSTLVFAVS